MRGPTQHVPRPTGVYEYEYSGHRDQVRSDMISRRIVGPEDEVDS